MAIPSGGPCPRACDLQGPIGVLTNPSSGGNRRGYPWLTRVSDLVLAEGTTPKEITEGLFALSRERIGLLVINGGDGTVQAVLTALFNHGMFPSPPLLCLLRSGTTSMLARDAGIDGPPPRAFKRILKAWKVGVFTGCAHLFERFILRVDAARPSLPLYGMFFGIGAVCQGIELFHSQVNPGGLRGEILCGVTALHLLFSLLFRGNRGMVPPVSAEISADGAPIPFQEVLFSMVTTLERLFLGLRPYWGAGSSPLRFTAVSSRPASLVRCLPSLVRGRPHVLMTEENGYCSRTASRLDLAFRGAFTLDGQLFENDGAITITPAGPLRFLRV